MTCPAIYLNIQLERSKKSGATLTRSAARLRDLAKTSWKENARGLQRGNRIKNGRGSVAGVNHWRRHRPSLGLPATSFLNRELNKARNDKIGGSLRARFRHEFRQKQ